MATTENISEKTRTLLDHYNFNADTLAGYLGLSTKQINDIANGNVECLLGKHTAIDKIMFLYVIGIEEADLKTSAFLEVLISYHHLSKITIAKMANVELSDIEKMIAGRSIEVDAGTKYKIAATVMALRFF